MLYHSWREPLVEYHTVLIRGVIFVCCGLLIVVLRMLGYLACAHRSHLYFNLPRAQFTHLLTHPHPLSLSRFLSRPLCRPLSHLLRDGVVATALKAQPHTIG